jgi:hypothetical protein
MAQKSTLDHSLNGAFVPKDNTCTPYKTICFKGVMSFLYYLQLYERLYNTATRDRMLGYIKERPGVVQKAV